VSISVYEQPERGFDDPFPGILQQADEDMLIREEVNLDLRKIR